MRDTRGGGAGQMHPFVQGLFEALPAPGGEWPMSKREQWLETARNIFALMYEEPMESAPVLRPVEPVWTPTDSEASLGKT